MLPQENLQPPRLFLLASETASGTKHYHNFQWTLLYSFTVTIVTLMVQLL